MNTKSVHSWNWNAALLERLEVNSISLTSDIYATVDSCLRLSIILIIAARLCYECLSATKIKKSVVLEALILPLHTMSLLTLELECLQREILNNDGVEEKGFSTLLDDWIITDSFENSDCEAPNSRSDHELNLFSQASNNSTKSKTGDTPNISVADLQHACEAEQAWQSIRCVDNVDAASFPSPDLYSCTCNRASGAYFVSLVQKTEELSSLINRDFPGYTMPMSPNSSPKTPLSHLFDIDGFQSLTIRNKSHSPASNSHLKTRNQLSRVIPITAMSTASQCRSL